MNESLNHSLNQLILKHQFIQMQNTYNFYLITNLVYHNFDFLSNNYDFISELWLSTDMSNLTCVEVTD